MGGAISRCDLIALVFKNNRNEKIHLERRTEVDGGPKGKTDNLHFHD
jgi:hypothetical protein